MKKLILPIEIIELEEGNYHLMINSELPDGTQGKWVIDTGASKSVFDSSLGKYYQTIEGGGQDEMLSAGIGIGEFEAKKGIIEKIKLEGLKVNKLKVALIDLAHINELYSKYASVKICGLIGSDFLYEHNAIINYSSRELILGIR